MNIQIFGTKKCFDTKKAIRYFKERNIKAQFIDLKEKGLSKGNTPRSSRPSAASMPCSIQNARIRIRWPASNMPSMTKKMPMYWRTSKS